MACRGGRQPLNFKPHLFQTTVEIPPELVVNPHGARTLPRMARVSACGRVEMFNAKRLAMVFAAIVLGGGVAVLSSHYLLRLLRQLSHWIHLSTLSHRIYPKLSFSVASLDQLTWI